MGRMPAWGWSILTMGVILADLLLGSGGKAGRALSRQVFWPVLSIVLVTTLFSYLEQYRHPTRRLALINAGAVVLLLFVTLPVWHFGVELPNQPGGPVVFRWWVNLVVAVIAGGVFAVLQWFTRTFLPRPNGDESKPERLTV